MTKSQFLLTLLVAACAASIGAFVAVATVWQGDGPAQAQDTSEKDPSGMPEFRRKVIDATEFRIVDSKGRVRGLYGVTKDDDVTLSLIDGDEKPRIVASSSIDGSANFKLLDQAGVERIVQFISADDVGQIALRGVDGRKDLTLTSTAEGETSIVLYGEDGKDMGIGLTVLADERSYLFLGKDGKERLRMIIDEKGEPHFFLLTDEGAAYFEAGE